MREGQSEAERLSSIISEMASGMMYACPSETPPGLPRESCGEKAGECEHCWLWYVGLQKLC